MATLREMINKIIDPLTKCWALSPSHILIHLILSSIMYDRCSYCPYCTDEKTDVRELANLPKVTQ